MKTSEFSERPFDQTPRFSISEFLVWGIMQTRKLGDGKTRSLIKMRRGWIYIGRKDFDQSLILFRARASYTVL